ncbi:MAG: type II toxin-antitoxin system RelE/ParE family toxin [archaeon]
MVTIQKVTRSPKFIKNTKKLDSFLLEKIKKQIQKIIENPEVGKPLKYKRGERSLYIKPFRLIYTLKEDELILLKFDHRKKVYND